MCTRWDCHAKAVTLYRKGRISHKYFEKKQVKINIIESFHRYTYISKSKIEVHKTDMSVSILTEKELLHKNVRLFVSFIHFHEIIFSLCGGLKEQFQECLDFFRRVHDSFKKMFLTKRNKQSFLEHN